MIAKLTGTLDDFGADWAVIDVAGVGYLLWLARDGCRGAQTAPGDVTAVPDGLPRLVGRGFLANILNPKAALFYVTLLPGFLREGHGSPAVQAAVFGVGHLLISGLVHGGIVLAAARAGRLLARTTGMAGLRKAMAVGIVLVAAWLAWQTRR